MPITVRHGPEDFAALAALAAVAGGRQGIPQLPRMPSISGLGGRGGGGGGGGGRGRPRTGAPRIPEMEISRGAAMREAQRLELERMQEEARLQQEGWKLEYTARDRAQIAKNNDAKRRLWANPRFSQEEKIIGDRAITLNSMGITKSQIPPDPNEPQYRPGRAPGDEFQDQGGNWHIVQPDGSTKMTLRWDQGPEAAQAKVEADRELKEIEVRAKLASESIDEKNKAGDVIGSRYRTEREVDERMEAIFGLPPERMPPVDIEGELIGGRQMPGPAMQPPIQPPTQPPESAVPRKLIGWSRSMGVRRTEADRDLPEFVGLARAFLREVRRKVQKGSPPTPRMSEAIQEAQAILSEYAAGGSS